MRPHEMSPLWISSCAPAAASSARRAVVCREGSISLASMDLQSKICRAQPIERGHIPSNVGGGVQGGQHLACLHGPANFVSAGRPKLAEGRQGRAGHGQRCAGRAAARLSARIFTGASEGRQPIGLPAPLASAQASALVPGGRDIRCQLHEAAHRCPVQPHIKSKTEQPPHHPTRNLHCNTHPSTSACPRSATASRRTVASGPTAGGETKLSSALQPSSWAGGRAVCVSTQAMRAWCSAGQQGRGATRAAALIRYQGCPHFPADHVPQPTSSFLHPAFLTTPAIVLPPPASPQPPLPLPAPLTSSPYR